MIIGYRGMMDLARRSGQVKRITARVVRKGDKFDYAYGLDERLTHTPDEAASGDITHVYAFVELIEGYKDFDVMSRAEVEAVRKRSKAGGDGPWVTDYGEMAKKTVIRRLLKRIPSSTELQQALTLQDLAESGKSQGNEAVIGKDVLEDVQWVDLPAEPTATEGLAAKLQAKANPNENRKKIPHDLPPLTFDELTDEEKACIIAQEKAENETKK